MAAREEQRDKDAYWVSELQSLGINPKKKNEPNNKKELEDLTDNIKQTLYQDYKTAYRKEPTDISSDLVI